MTDELELLRDWDADAAPLTDPARAEARHRLLNTIARAQRHSDAVIGRRRALRLATAAVVAVAVTGTAVLITEGGADGGDRSDRVSGTATPRMSNVSAVTVLNGAAARTGRHERPVAPRDDQYIYSKRIIKETERGTGAVKTYEDVNWDSVDGSKRSLTMELGRVIWEKPMKKGEGVWPPRKWSELKRLPTDPEKLIPVITDIGSSSRSTSDFTAQDWFDAYFMLGELLKWPVLPQGLRPAAYKALALVPGVEAVPGVKDSAGRTGVGISCPESPFGKGKYLIFDPGSYEFLGFRDERTSASGDKTYIQLSHVVEWAIVDRLKERP
ncbi:CU044_5270 family protein [Streptomyces triticiradicis]|uniref:Tat pathway signal protein n=1 Tax=Streptomyces triticiradicis TaxID=2651189 RepID=A0A7J5DB46_9ACTN|nr:CU044_5270 family protein [Streptomyces triticiradicis]KAB1985717.1 Tat pathway signal protein [Streptomyces triticiradicis]